ncbi:MAG TPA: hypothetical protein VGF75_08060 [Candidatus Saccharimonadales bacterium]|jgi:hypothetical protein
MGTLASSLGLPANAGQIVAGAGHSIGSDIANIGNASSGVIPQGQPGGAPSTIPMPQLKPLTGPTAPTPLSVQASPTPTGTVAPVAAPQYPTSGYANPGTASTVSPGTVPMANGVPVGETAGGDFNSVYGVDTGTDITNLYNEEGTGAASTAQAIINANAPNVAQGAANLNTGLAASGISPSSSVSAIENANYQGQVQQQNLSEEAQVSLTEQQMQQQLLESLLPSQQTRQTDSSGWSIFGDILGGVGDVAGAALQL